MGLEGEGRGTIAVLVGRVTGVLGGVWAGGLVVLGGVGLEGRLGRDSVLCKDRLALSVGFLRVEGMG